MLIIHGSAAELFNLPRRRRIFQANFQPVVKCTSSRKIWRVYTLAEFRVFRGEVGGSRGLRPKVALYHFVPNKLCYKGNTCGFRNTVLWFSNEYIFWLYWKSFLFVIFVCALKKVGFVWGHYMIFVSTRIRCWKVPVLSFYKVYEVFGKWLFFC